MKRVAWPPVGPHAVNETEQDDVNGAVSSPPRRQDGMTQQYRNESNSRFSDHQVSPGQKVAPPVPPKPGTREIAHAQVRQVVLWLAQVTLISTEMISLSDEEILLFSSGH